MQRRAQGWGLLAAIALLIAACGQADPSFAPAGAPDASPVELSTPAATPTAPITAITTPSVTPTVPAVATPVGTAPASYLPANWIDLPAEYTTRTAAQAEALALDTAQNTLGAFHPHVAQTWLLTQREMAQGTDQALGEGDDPLALIWWVDLDDDDYVIPRCPYLKSAGTPVGCGSSTYAGIEIVASNGAQPGLTVGRNFTPTRASSDVSISQDARLRTEGEAIAALLQSVQGVNEGSSPQITAVRLLSARDWLQEQADQGVVNYLPLAPDEPVWEVSATNAAYAIPCILQDTSKCVLFNVTLALDAVTGDQLMYSGRPATTTP